MIRRYSEFKVFEKDNYNYYEIDDQEFSYLKFNKSVDFENRYIDFLIKLKSKYNDFFTNIKERPAPPQRNPPGRRTRFDKSYLSLEQNTIEYSIYQLEDDYFLVAIFNPDSNPTGLWRNNIGIKVIGSENFYKCDQIEGLLFFLENLINSSYEE